MENSKWKIQNGKFKMENSKWKIQNVRLTTNLLSFSIFN